MNTATIDRDVLDFMKTLIFGSVKDPLAAASFRAYRDFNRTLTLDRVDKKTRVQLRNEVTDQLQTCFNVLQKYWTRSREQYDVWHERTCYDVRGIYLSRKVPFTFGQAQKWVNMTIKYLYVLDDRGFDDFLDYLHVPVDNKIIAIAEREFGIPKPNKVWSKWDYDEYLSYQLTLRKKISGCSPFRWEMAAWNVEAGK